MMKKLAKRGLSRLLLGVCLFGSHQVFAKEILTATPVTYMLATQLMQGTPVSTTYVAPKRYGIERLPNWFASKGSEKIKQYGEQALVAITLKALWAEDPLFTFARQGNINLIEIDAAQAISPRAKGVASVTRATGDKSIYAWLNPNNLATMLSIVSDDLQRVWPEYKPLIIVNQQKLLVQIRLMMNHQQQALFDKNIDSVVLISDQLEDFVASNQLFVVERLLKPALEWTEQDNLALQKIIEASPDTWVVTSSKISAQMKQLLPGFSNYLVIDKIDRWGSAGITVDEPLQRWLF